MNETIQQADYMFQWVHLKKQLSYTYFWPTIWQIPLITGYQMKLHELFHLWESRSGSHSFFPWFLLYSLWFRALWQKPWVQQAQRYRKILNNLIKISEKIEHEFKKWIKILLTGKIWLLSVFTFLCECFFWKSTSGTY